MFTFHRPKIYRSVAGCCICKAKSSSSRFTDSKKYENEFEQCFNLMEGQKRTGEICNACVLLIKRWKKLPKGTERNWNHVVDARAGPGGKSQLRHKLKPPKPSSPSSLYSNNCNNNNPGGAMVSGDHRWTRRQKKRNAERKKRMQLLDGLRTRSHADSEDASPPSPTPSDTSDTSVASQPTSRAGSISSDILDELPPLLASIIDTSYWKMEKVCCGTIFKGNRGEIMVHPALLRPCATSPSFVHRTASTSKLPSSALKHPSPSLSCNKGVASDGIGANKRGTRQDSVGSEGSNDSLESDDLCAS